MTVLPKKTGEMIQWCMVRAPIWVDNAAAIGLTLAQANAFETLATTAQGALNAQAAALQAYRDATVMLRDAARDLRRAAGDNILIIKGFAAVAPKPAQVYTLAQIPPPSPPGTLPPPGIPFDMRALLNPGGSLTLSWKCNNPPGAAGTIYTVRRRPTGGAWEFVGAVGLRKFEDENFDGTNPVQYQIQAQRGTSTGLPSSIFTVQFGTGGGGFFISSQFEEEGEGQAKLAA